MNLVETANKDNPILNSPYDEPLLYYSTDSDGSLDYTEIRKGRRIFKESTPVAPTKRKGGKEIFEWNESAGSQEEHIVNLCRKEVGAWRASSYPNTTRISKQLLNFWFNNPERHAVKKLFFAQREAIETAIWFNEVAEKSNPGQHILNLLRKGQQTVSKNTEDQLPRIAFKMATGSGKTVVMACLICYHYFNRQEYRNDTRFADYFLVVAPGITIKSRLNVLFVDNQNHTHNREDYYYIRGLVPSNMTSRLQNLNARLIITNYHSFEPKILQGNKKTPFDGKTNIKGEKIDTDNKEGFSQVVKRVLGKFKTGSRLLVLNDEAHHCYLPKSKSKTTDNEGDENAKAAVWFSGLRNIAQKFKMQAVYDLSATPYYLNGSGYTAYSLFPWVVSDFGLVEAIESGLVKIPFMPETDDTQSIDKPVLKNLYEHVKKELPKKGVSKRKAEAKAKGDRFREEAPKIPALVKNALEQFYSHYVKYDKGVRSIQEDGVSLFSTPPVFIVVCNNTSVSKEVYKYIAGYEYTDREGGTHIQVGAKDLFSNYDPDTTKPRKKPPTLLIDSDALENGEQINKEFKKIFAKEIEEFKKDYARMHGQGSTEKISDAEILREVVNTVGQTNKLGAHIRCVVSVSMLTEGWDANTVTHIMGLRAFGSQLLCEQVAGRALRRVNYFLQGYDKDGNPTDDKRKIVIQKFPPEYAHIIGVPFNMFKAGQTNTVVKPVNMHHINALVEREQEMEITFPNIIAYRTENLEAPLTHDFANLENYEIDGSKVPKVTTMQSAVSAKQETIQLADVLEKRDQEIIFKLTVELMKYHFSNDEGEPEFQKFATLKGIVTEWYNHKITVLNREPYFKKTLYFHEHKKAVDHIIRGINTQRNTIEFIKPVFNNYNPFGSTRYVNGNTTREVYATQKSHVNYVVMDSTWEGVCAKTLEELDNVIAYVKNDFLDFAIPYKKDGEDKKYFPDFIVKVKSKQNPKIFKNLIIEISGFSQDKDEKKWFVENRWLPAANALKDKYQYHEWHFIEIANDIRNIRNQLTEKIQSI
ncbi:MAG: DEAD/DEAH box helicase family protein [Bernardetiaceae bacterium]|nr:DEAD/DEAH box helicase family protein [Bernardetiaceae bacterium]